MEDLEASPRQLAEQEYWEGVDEERKIQERDERQLQDNDYEYASRIVQEWLLEAEMRTTYPREVEAVKFLAGLK